ncbi:MAG: NarK/NasA family nitrate transporter [Planctomycetia bacterium]|nr:NarK/NasA family nitrate transporter [Planctomycetia bacterium]
MHLRAFLKAGHTPSLLCAFLYFDISFMVWVLLGALANAIVPDLGLNDAERGLMIALPLLGGALLRLVLGLLTDHIGARRTGIIGLSLTVLPLLLGWLWADSFPAILLVGLLLGVAGASFAAALPLASRWYPPQYQGLAMGIAGAGNSGTALATFFGPRLALWMGWQGVFALALVPIVLTLLVFIIFAKDSPNQPPAKPLRDYASVLKLADTWWFCLFYSVTFGGFVGLASFLNSFFKIQYELDAVSAGNFATLCVIAGSLLRPVGGYLADRLGGIRMLTMLYLGVGAVMLGLSGLPPLLPATLLLFLGMSMLGMGNGSVFQLVPQRFPKEIGVLTGLVGAAGGIGGFFLPNLLGTLRYVSGTFAGGFFIFGLCSIACAAALLHVSRTWERTFVAQGGLATTAEQPVVAPLEPAAVSLAVEESAS